MTIVVGKILKPQGIRGELKILPLTDDITRFKSVKYLIVKGQAMPVLSLRIVENYVYARLHGIMDRNSAELVRDEYVSVKRQDAIKLEEGKHFIVDLLGSKIYADGDYVGVLDDILQNTRTDVYVVKGAKNCMFPIVDGLIVNTDTSSKRIDLKKSKLQEIVVYED